MKSMKLSLVVAVCQANRGIGVDGTLPWKIPGDMAYFKKLTTETRNAQKQNAVIMGRKTWESIPGKFRPLSGRLNVVVSTTLQNLPPGVHLASSFENALELLGSCDLQDCIEAVFIIGGVSLYKVALDSPYCYRIYLTEVLKEFKCDTFLPEIDLTSFEPVELPDVPKDEQMHGDIPYRFKVYQKQMLSNSLNDNCLPPIAICVAVELNNGIGMNGALPWPYIKKDYENFISLVTHTENPDKKPVIIKARKTWESTTKEEEQALSSTIRIVISTSMTTRPENVDYLVDSFKKAVDVALKLWRDGQVEKIWILGGKQIYQEAIDSPLCQRIYLTRILASFGSDVFFPAFDHKFKLIQILKEEYDEESHVDIRCEVYDKS